MQRNFRSPRFDSRIPALAAITLLNSCQALKTIRSGDPTTPLTPATWTAIDQGQQGKISSGWVSEFRDPQLSRLVQEALHHNQDLQSLAARMRQARENRIIGRSRLLPDLDLNASAGNSSSANGPSPRTSSDSFGLTLSSAWEPDLWGRLRRLQQADDADVQAIEANYRGARLSLAASTARAWCNLIAAQQQLELARRTEASYQRILGIIERIYQGTGQGALDVQLGRNNVSAASRNVKESQLNRDEAARTLELLLGRYPKAEIQPSLQLPHLNTRIPAGLPAEWIERRPDLAAARANLLASTKRAEAARRSLLPGLTLTASAGTPVSSFSNLLNPDWLRRTIAANLDQILFDGGSLAAQSRAADAAREALLHDYTQTALTAFREVESALAAEVSLAGQELDLEKEIEQAALAERQAERDYSEGLDDDILRVLESQRRAANARAGLIRLRNQRLLNRIDLHLALGGDFHTPAPRS